MFDVGISSIKGDREYQEDSFAVTDPYGSNADFSKLEDLLMIVADGVGGAISGEAASQLVCLVGAKSIQTSIEIFPDKDSVKYLLNDVLAKINTQFAQVLEENPEFEGMATTIVLSLILNKHLYWISVGDSHLYLVRNKQISKLNADHSMCAILDKQVANGDLSLQEAVDHPERFSLYSFIDGHEIRQIDLSDNPLALEENDIILLASDGLNSLSDLDILEILNLVGKNQSAQALADELTNEVIARKVPEQDNTTVSVLHIVPE